MLLLSIYGIVYARDTRLNGVPRTPLLRFCKFLSGDDTFGGALCASWSARGNQPQHSKIRNTLKE